MTETRWLTSDQLAMWMRFVAVVELLPGVLDGQLQRDASLTHFEYVVMAHLSGAPERSMRMTRLAHATTASLPRLSHVVKRLEARGLVDRTAEPSDRRATNTHLTDEGMSKLILAAPGHATAVLQAVIDPLSDEQVGQLNEICIQMLTILDPVRARLSAVRHLPE